MNAEDKENLDSGFDCLLLSPARLPIIVLLAMYDEADFTFLKTELKMSDGNLGANLTRLEDEGFLISKKMFIGRKPKSVYKITDKGLEKLRGFIKSMETIGKSLDNR